MFRCSCFYTNNYFIKDLEMHVFYSTSRSFCVTYRHILKSHGYDTEESIHDITNMLEQEKLRRENEDRLSAERKAHIARHYVPLHAELYNLNEKFLHDDFLKIVDYCVKEKPSNTELMQKLQLEKGDQVYSFPVFTDEFCQKMIEEISHFEKSDMPKGRPNTMNNYGLLLDELGMYDVIEKLMVNYLQPVVDILYKCRGLGKLDSHKSFTVSYAKYGDQGLSYHYDNSEITINISLNNTFTGGSLYFGDIYIPNQSTSDAQVLYTESQHRLGHGILHRGAHRHGAMEIEEGDRMNLIIWMRSSKSRGKLCPMCGEKPKLVPACGRGDGFKADTVDMCNVT